MRGTTGDDSTKHTSKEIFGAIRLDLAEWEALLQCLRWWGLEGGHGVELDDWEGVETVGDRYHYQSLSSPVSRKERKLVVSSWAAI